MKYGLPAFLLLFPITWFLLRKLIKVEVTNIDVETVREQLQKNQSLTIITCDPRQEVFAVQEGVINAVDIQETLTPLTLNYILDQAKPDLILLARASEDFGLGKAPGVDVMVDSLKRELASISKVPLLEIARGTA